ncbi:MAG TPA: MBL fold metallo-hydrolase [Verrucomicrobiae bacterium]
MGIVATEVQEILPGVFRWECFSPEHKVELTSHAVLVDGQLFIFDPIGLTVSAKQRLLSDHHVAAIVLTNENHERSADEWRKETNAPVWASAEAKLVLENVNRWEAGTVRWNSWEIVPLPGGAGGEVALCWRERSLVVLGDAVFNLPKYGFDVLPKKYCRDQAMLKTSLLKLIEMPFDTVIFAHGTPLLKVASVKIRELVDG